MFTIVLPWSTTNLPAVLSSGAPTGTSVIQWTFEALPPMGRSNRTTTSSPTVTVDDATLIVGG
jgi:hypothetical protein